MEHDSLVDPDWLAEHLGEAGLCVVDASWHLPNSGRHAEREYLNGHIPGAVFFDIDRVADNDSPLPHMLPDAGDFADEAGRLGIDNETLVVVYDSLGLFSAARVWWMFRVFGHDRVVILDGGLPAWEARGLPLETGAVDRSPVRFVAELDRARVWALEDVRWNLDTGRARLFDARPPERFAGTAPEPRPGLPSGHIPGSVNVPFAAVTDPETGRVRPPHELRALFADPDQRPAVCSCGTGVTACVVAFALHCLGHDDVAIYDGSWTEWAGHGGLPIATGPGDRG
ncbi:MAG: 3-mercaptopyruvate sulfurtransferase [Halofilum sp. (in: g-proteobacteria)]